MVAGLFKLGFITAFLSRPVMDGFRVRPGHLRHRQPAAKLFGLTKGDGDTIAQWPPDRRPQRDERGHVRRGRRRAGRAVPLERYLPRLPGGLLVLVAGIAVSAAFDLASHGVATVGEIPTGLPTPNVPDVALTDLWVLLPSAAGMMLVIFSEALGAGQMFADKYGYRLDPSQEMIALGATNVGFGPARRAGVRRAASPR